MPDDFAAVFKTIQPVIAGFAKGLAVKTDTSSEYTLETRKPSPFPQHKGQPLFFASLKIGKAYVSYHLLPVYMSPALNQQVTPELKKRMQGKACFNFKTPPDRALLASLKKLTQSALADWKTRNWV